MQALGYRVDAKGVIFDESGKEVSKLGARRAVISDLSPAATFISNNYNTLIVLEEFEFEANRILSEVSAELGWMFETKDILKPASSKL